MRSSRIDSSSQWVVVYSKVNRLPRLQEWIQYSFWYLLYWTKWASAVAYGWSLWSGAILTDLWCCEGDTHCQMWYSMDITENLKWTLAHWQPISILWYHVAWIITQPNQFQAFGIDIDNLFDSSQELRMDCSEVFYAFDTTDTVVPFKSRRPTDWEIKQLLQIYISGDQWNPTDNGIFPECKTWEQMEMHTIKSLTSGMMKHDMQALRLEQA